jgi:hypothetical protein
MRSAAADRATGPVVGGVGVNSASCVIGMNGANILKVTAYQAVALVFSVRSNSSVLRLKL